MWGQLVEQAWGSEFRAPDHGVYTFGKNGRKFDSTDRGANSGLYAVDPYDFVIANDNYPDMRTEIKGFSGENTTDVITRAT